MSWFKRFKKKHNARKYVDKWFPRIPILNLFYKYVTWKNKRNEPKLEPNFSQRLCKVKDGYSGKIEFKILDMKHLQKPKDNNNQDVERFVFEGKGSNIDRFSLYTLLGKGRIGRIIVRSKIEEGHKNYYNHKSDKAFSDNQPGWASWCIEWGKGKLSVTINGKLIKSMSKPVDFHGVLESFWMGGDGTWKRTPFGWADLKINGEQIS